MQLLERGLNEKDAKTLKKDIWNHILRILSSHLDQLRGSKEKDVLKTDILSVLADSIITNSQQLSQKEVNIHACTYKILK